MNQSPSRPRSALAAVFALVLASLVLAACGGSSSSTTTTSANASATTSTTGGAPGGGASRFAALRECLQKNGITLPKRTPGTGKRPSGGGFRPGGGFLSGARQLPKGVTRAQYEAAIKKCGGFPGGGRFGAGGGGRFLTPAVKAAVAKFASCMSENGVKIPTANTSGKGPIFNTKGLNTSSAQFKSASAKCEHILPSTFRAAPGAAGGAPGAAPPSAG
jgi:hypothetical protein